MPEDPPTIDEELGKTLRELGIEAVTRPSWHNAAIRAVSQIKHLVDEPFALEHIRFTLLSEGLIGPPHHPNAWGAFGMALSRKNIIERTGEWRNASGEKAHARMVPLYNWRTP